MRGPCTRSIAGAKPQRLDLRQLSARWRQTIALATVRCGRVARLAIVGPGSPHSRLAVPALVWMGVLTLLCFSERGRN
jgi:hypothetical protein